MIYCISDIHGEYNRYLDILELIEFSDDDTLYILGDVIDRGSQGVKILLDIMDRPDVKMILGNHEHMCLATLGPKAEIGARQLWQENGGSTTRRSLLYGEGKEHRGKILRFLQDLPDRYDIEVGGREFHLVHGYPGKNQDERLWNRPKVDESEPVPGGVAVVGHTPTVYLYRTLTYPKRFGSLSHRGIIFHNVLRHLHRPFLDLSILHRTASIHGIHLNLVFVQYMRGN